MSTAENDPQPLTEELQFDRAEYATEAESAQPTAPICTACKAPIQEVYFEAGGNLLCATCRDRIEASLQGGSRLGRAFKAFGFGSIAAAVGAALYYGILRLTGYNFGLVAVVVGVMVGGAVKAGSGSRGGWFYQLLAVFLTYSSIVAMFAVPEFVEAMQNPGQAVPAEAVHEEEQAERRALKPNPDAPKAEPAKEAELKAAEPEAAENAEADLEPRPSVLAWVLLTVVILGFVYSIPIQIAIAAPISGLIFAFALWEAWKINRKTRLAFNGPFRLGDAVGGAVAAGSGGQGDVA